MMKFTLFATIVAAITDITSAVNCTDSQLANVTSISNTVFPATCTGPAMLPNTTMIQAGATTTNTLRNLCPVPACMAAIQTTAAMYPTCDQSAAMMMGLNNATLICTVPLTMNGGPCGVRDNFVLQNVTMLPPPQACLTSIVYNGPANPTFQNLTSYTVGICASPSCMSFVQMIMSQLPNCTTQGMNGQPTNPWMMFNAFVQSCPKPTTPTTTTAVTTPIPTTQAPSSAVLATPSFILAIAMILALMA